jgi:hypothetical protein
LGLGSVPQPLVAADVELSTPFLALIPVEDAEIDTDTGAERVKVIRVAERRIVRPPHAESRIGRAIGDR